MREVLVIVGPEVVADAELLGEIARREFAALGVAGRLVHARDAAHVRSLMRTEDVVVVVPAPGPDARTLLRQPPGTGVVVPVDIDRVPGARHIHGRGLAGLAWAIRHAVHRARHPQVRRIPYGPSPEQWGDLYLPPAPEAGAAVAGAGPAEVPGAAGVPGGVPVVALVHGGYWRSVWAADLMEALCADLAARGFAAWNLEYRPPDLHGWAATRHDITAGLAALHAIAPTTPAGPTLAARRAEPGHGPDAPDPAEPRNGPDAPDRAEPQPSSAAPGQAVPQPPALDLDRIVVAGHSAGAQLALRAVADGARVALAVSLAGVLDLQQTDRRWLSHGAMAAALSQGALDEGELLASSPLLRLPLGVPQIVVQGRGDDVDLVDFSRRYVAAARQAGDEVTYLELPGDHQDVITPGTPIWQATAAAITRAVTAAVT
ncbi:alpha/beta hydrolase fold domain-containing protein [Nonomuraea sp. FMUSA5-5]|uniref:Alpha/beta hydrolase fold domain-containing protein n=1 Tax=Nonomuraea composti TaxID=2720023 RepID=A0ABX1BBZ7_9ACTN|nr:alpha/beta hydrolase fold domain-containing protein [Nonomuraea sp. FMUSA5-5]NJP95319.1 alpha/beta hydrolase fold domain-containing protein [Nonomuraea sp. FMUSA5-5]